MATESSIQGLFSQLQLIPEKTSGKHTSCGFKLIPDSTVGEGFFWTFPVNPYFSVTIYHLIYYKDIQFSYHHPARLIVSLSSPTVVETVSTKLSDAPEQLHGYYLPDGEYNYVLPANRPIDAISMTFTPKFYNDYLGNVFHRDFSDFPQIVEKLDGTFDIPQVVAILKTLEDYDPSMVTSTLFYEAKALELVSHLIDWYVEVEAVPPLKSINTRDYETIQTLIHFLEQHYCESLDVCNLAKMCKMSKSKLSELFRSIAGVTIIDFINSLRIDLAKELLSKSNYQIGEIASIIGYAQQSSFTFLFKQRVNMSPRDYRKLNRVFPA